MNSLFAGLDADAAARVLRGLLIEHLQARAEAGALPLPGYEQRVVIERALIHVSEDVSWAVRPVGSLQWQPQAAAREPVARAPLDSRAELQLFVVVDGAGPAFPLPRTGAAQLVCRCPLPPLDAPLDRQGVELYLAQHMQMAWLHHPDTLGLVAAAHERLEARGRQIYRNWLAMADAAGGPATVDGEDESRPAPLFHGGMAVPEEVVRHACAPGHAPNVSFTLYRLSDREAWLFYLLERTGPLDWRHVPEKSYALAPFPAPFDGWAEALPASVGAADVAQGIVRCRGFLDAVTYLSRRSQSTCSGRDPAAFLRA